MASNNNESGAPSQGSTVSPSAEYLFKNLDTSEPDSAPSSGDLYVHYTDSIAKTSSTPDGVPKRMKTAPSSLGANYCNYLPYGMDTDVARLTSSMAMTYIAVSDSEEASTSGGFLDPPLFVPTISTLPHGQAPSTSATKAPEHLTNNESDMSIGPVASSKSSEYFADDEAEE